MATSDDINMDPVDNDKDSFGGPSQTKKEPSKPIKRERPQGVRNVQHLFEKKVYPERKVHEKGAFKQYVRGEKDDIPRDKKNNIKGKKYYEYKYSVHADELDRASILSKKQATNLVALASKGNLTKISPAGLSILNAMWDNAYIDIEKKILEMASFGQNNGYMDKIFGHATHVHFFNEKIRPQLDAQALEPPDMSWAKKQRTKAMETIKKRMDTSSGKALSMYMYLPSLYKLQMTVTAAIPWHHAKVTIPLKYTNPKMQKRLNVLVTAEGQEQIVFVCTIGWLGKYASTQADHHGKKQSWTPRISNITNLTQFMVAFQRRWTVSDIAWVYFWTSELEKIDWETWKRSPDFVKGVNGMSKRLDPSKDIWRELETRAARAVNHIAWYIDLVKRATQKSAINVTKTNYQSFCGIDPNKPPTERLYGMFKEILGGIAASR